MTRPARLFSTLAIVPLAIYAFGLSLAHPGRLSAGEFKLNDRTFVLPEGFTIELLAAPPVVDRPIVADFDENGTLYVADSSGSNDPVAKQVVERPHRILRLVDRDGDGRFDTHTVFADKMMFPEGTLWHEGSLYVSAPPSIWKLTDTDGDGVADQRVEWFQGKTLTGCANDLHGPYLGRDGWIYWCKGAFAKQTYERAGKSPFVTRASHIFRQRSDGTGFEPVMTGGMDNPVDTVFTPGGERIFSTTFLIHPGGGKRDGLIHAIYGGIYGKIHDVIFDPVHKWTGPDVLPTLVHLGPAAAAGLASYESDVFGPGYKNNIFACNFNLRKITRHALTPSGATFSTKDEDFLVSKDQDFHPTDTFEDADGSLVVVDTGGWYKLCCPTSQLQKPDVLGAIYRIRRTGAPNLSDPRGVKLDWAKAPAEELVKRLDDPRPAVRQRAIATLGKKGVEAIAALRSVLEPVVGSEAASSTKRGAEARVNSVWAACRIDHKDARALVRRAMNDTDEIVRQAAIHSASVNLDRDAVPMLIGLLKGKSLHNRRAAAEALGRLGDRSAIPAILEAAGAENDRTLEHSLTYALIEIADPAATSAGLESQNPRTRRAALVALDQMNGGGLKPGHIAADLQSSDKTQRDVASWIAGRHPEWANDLVAFFRSSMKSLNNSSSSALDDLASQVARFAQSVPIQQLLAESLQKGHDSSRNTAITALHAMAKSGLKEMPESWISAISDALSYENLDVKREAIEAARALPTTPARAAKLTAKLLETGSDAKNPVQLRLDAFAAIPGGVKSVSDATFSFVREHLDPDAPVAERTAAANILARAKLTDDQLLALTDTVKTSGPIEVDKLLTAYEASKDDAVGLKLINALKDSHVLSSLRVDMLKPRFDKYGERIRQQAEAIYATLNVDAAKQKARLEALLPTLADGDIRRGQQVFNGQKAACLTCHAVGYVGGNIGPDLTRIGQIRNERDLLEAILYPSLSFVRSYEPITVATKAGKVVNGLLKKDSADELVLVVAANEEAHIPRDDVEEMRPGTVSVMPAGLDQQLSRQDLADLLAFLKTRK